MLSQEFFAQRKADADAQEESRRRNMDDRQLKEEEDQKKHDKEKSDMLQRQMGTFAAKGKKKDTKNPFLAKKAGRGRGRGRGKSKAKRQSTAGDTGDWSCFD